MIQFEWDHDKATTNHKKHGVYFKEALLCFMIPYPPLLSIRIILWGEQRLITIGFSSRDRLLVVSHTDRGETIRIINARQATARERKRHEI